MPTPRRKGFLLLTALVAGIFGASQAFCDAVTCEELLDQGFPGFSLPSQQGHLVVYDDDYYGKHHLILTFFPAAFTPV